MKRVSRVFWLIILLTIFAIWVNLPPTSGLPDKVNLLGSKVSLNVFKSDSFKFTIEKKEINLSFLAPANLFGKFPLKLGLDLQGGTEIVLRTKMDTISPSDRDTALESARSVIERRVNFFGVSESVVQVSKVGEDRRIIIQLPGVKDLQTAVSLVGKTAQLDFREQVASPSATPEASASAGVDQFGFKSTGLTGADLKKASVVYNSSNGGNNGPEVQIDFTDQGASKFAEITKRNVGKPLGIFLDGLPISWPPPIVQQEILGGTAVITGNFTPDQAKDLAVQLNAGALPVPIEILSQQQVDPTLGVQFLQKSLFAGVVGILIVMVYMIGFYGKYGLVADAALLIYALFTLAVFRTGLFVLPQVTLTLAGIAGFILSIGMAVDANILTFERIKEEKRQGKTGKVALEHGFSRAWTSIRDSNLSSIITASILYVLGNSVVKGFALTLAIGVLISMLSAVVITRTLMRRLPEYKQSLPFADAKRK